MEGKSLSHYTIYPLELYPPSISTKKKDLLLTSCPLICLLQAHSLPPLPQMSIIPSASCPNFRFTTLFQRATTHHCEHPIAFFDQSLVKENKLQPSLFFSLQMCHQLTGFVLFWWLPQDVFLHLFYSWTHFLGLINKDT